LLPGKYSVKLSSTEPRTAANSGDAPGGFLVVRELLPAKYNARTELTAEITAENPNQINFHLE